MTMKIFMPILLIVVGVLVIGGVLLLKRTSSGTSTTQNAGARQIQKNISESGSTGANQTSGAGGSMAPTKSPAVAGIKLTVSSPVTGSTVKAAKLTVKGITSPGADVSVNETDTKADSSGNFSASVTLDEGENTLIIVSSDIDGNYSEQEVIVTYDTGVTY
ncbi:hypothetical protein HY947_02145 [Candidatus Gottesmanbacteria bacterium]|nr:hypothetical protein [Candidatus Gottesmanbacteria bacterium]